MALVGNTYLGLKDLLAQKENGKVTNTIIDLMSQTSPLVEDAVVKECNDGSTHKTTVRNGLPEVEFRKFYEGVTPSKGQYTQVVDTTGMLEAYSNIDKSLADIANDKDQFRLNESLGFLEAMTQTVEKNLFYGKKATNPAGFDGLATRYGKISSTAGSIGNQIIDAGGTGSDNTSIWFITWGDLHTHLIYPKGSQAGISHKDLGEQTQQNSDGSMYQVYRSHFKR